MVRGTSAAEATPPATMSPRKRRSRVTLRIAVRSRRWAADGNWGKLPTPGAGAISDSFAIGGKRVPGALFPEATVASRVDAGHR
jgi:hypothetical protein